MRICKVVNKVFAFKKYIYRLVHLKKKTNQFKYILRDQYEETGRKHRHFGAGRHFISSY